MAAVVFTFEVLPIAVIVLASFGTASFVEFPPRGFTLEWYRRLLGKEAFGEALEVTALLAGFAVTISLVLAAPTAYALTRFAFRFRMAFDVATLAPVIVPEIILALALLQLAALLGGSASLGLGILGHTVLAFPFVLRTTLANLAGLDPTIEEAAIGLGASRWIAFWRVIVPNIHPGLIAGGLLGATVSFDAFFVSMFLVGRRTLPLEILDMLRFDFNPSILALSTLIIVANVPVIMIVERTVGLRALVGAGRT
jgi:putative spermidine/putrescine transport system permease protein